MLCDFTAVGSQTGTTKGMEQCILCATDTTAPSPPLPISPCPSVGEGALRPLDAQLLGRKSWKDKDSRTCGGFSGQRRLQAHEGDLGVAHGGRRTSSHRQGRLDFSVHADTIRGASSADVSGKVDELGASLPALGSPGSASMDGGMSVVPQGLGSFGNKKVRDSQEEHKPAEAPAKAS